MLKKMLLGTVLMLPFGVSIAHAQTPDLPTPPDMKAMLGSSDEDMVGKMEQFRAAVKNLSPEQREAIRAEKRQRMESMPPEERKALHEKIRQRMEAMTPEQRDRMRAAMGHDNREGGPLRSDRMLRFDGQKSRALPPPPLSENGEQPPPSRPVDNGMQPRLPEE